MNQLLSALQQQPNTRTANGDAAHESMLDSGLDFFGKVGSLRSNQTAVKALFNSAFKDNKDLAIRIALWARDVRGGAGERQSFRTILHSLATNSDTVEIAARLADITPEVGRFDDLLVLLNTPARNAALVKIAQELQSGNQLCAKWMPRKGPEAALLAKEYNLSPKQWRKLLVSLTNVVETQMCAKQWSEIEFGKIPSLAAARYQKAFERNAPAEYAAYAKALEKGEAKINAGAIFPHDVVISALNGNDQVATAQWKALPDYMEGTNQKVLAMVDVSGSMSCKLGNQSKATASCMHVAVALGLYCAERNEGPFKNHFVTFTDTPRLVSVNPADSLTARYRAATRHVGYDTNIDKAYQLILKTAVQYSVPQEDMPTMLLVLSDMQFNNNGYGYKTAHQRLKEMFKQAGYEMPQLVYWNLNASYGNTPITKHNTGACMVSGFSPAIMASVLRADDFSPYTVMLEAVMKDRYKWM